MVYIPVHEYVYLFHCDRLRGGCCCLLLAAVNSYEYDDSFSDKLHQKEADYGSIDSSYWAGAVFTSTPSAYMSIRNHWQLHLSRGTCCDGCVVCCRFFLPNPVSILILHQTAKRGKDYMVGHIYLVSDACLRCFPFEARCFRLYLATSSVVLASSLPRFVVYFIDLFSLFFFLYLVLLSWFVFFFISLVAYGVGGFSES